MDSHTDRGVRNAVKDYLDRGWKPIPIPKGEKGPRTHDWQKATYEPKLADFDGESNVGVSLGEASGWLVDVDIDRPEALVAARLVLPRTQSMFGRPGKPSSHWLYVAEGAKTSQFTGVEGKANMLIELRSTRGQTVFPPSTHPTGEEIAWEAERDPLKIDAATLYDMVRLTAVATLVGIAWPNAAGQHHNAAGALGGVLARCKVEPDAIGQVLKAVCAIAGDKEVDDRVRFARESAEKLARGEEKVNGGPALGDMLGDKVLARLRRWLGAEEEVEGIDAGEQDLAKVTTEAWDALVRANEPEPRLFRREGLPVRVERTDDGRSKLEALDVDMLRHEAARASPWFTRRGKRVDAAMPPIAVMRDMLAQSEMPLPVVTRIVSAPIVAADGTVQTATGYSPATRTYYPAPGLSIPPVADAPSKADVARAVSLVLDDVLGDFPFVADADRAHAFAAFLLPFVREMVNGETPMHLIEKPTVGTGATLLASVLIRPSVGVAPPMLTEPSTTEEWDKLLLSTLIDGPTAVVFDNIKSLDNEKLASALTKPTYQGRILGRSKNAEVPIRCTWIATGNNPHLSFEVMRRCARIRLDARVDRPWMHRRFRHDNLSAWVDEHRGDLVWAALTVARAWVAAGRPRGMTTIGSYEEWARALGGMLAVAGVPGFLGNLETFYAAHDAEGDALRWFVAEWRARHQFKAVTPGELRLFGLAEDSLLHAFVGGKTDKQLSANFGFFVRRLKDRVFTLDDGMRVRIEDAGKSRNITQWRLSRGDGGPEQVVVEEATGLF